jgi:hypothetical protein
MEYRDISDFLLSFPMLTPLHLHSRLMEESGRDPWMPGPEEDYQSAIWTLVWLDTWLLAMTASYFVWGPAQWTGTASWASGMRVAGIAAAPTVGRVGIAAARSTPYVAAAAATVGAVAIVDSMLPVAAYQQPKPWWLPFPIAGMFWD